MKCCSKCGEVKPPSGFIKNSTRPDGLDSECRRCRAIREALPETRDAKWERHLKKAYGLTRSDYEAILKDQGGLCAICKQPEKRTNKFGEPLPLSVDHDHRTGQVRGLLCSAHNTAIGALGDTPDGVLSAFLYLYGVEQNG